MSAISPYVVCWGEEKSRAIGKSWCGSFVPKSRATCVPGFLNTLFLIVDFLESDYVFIFNSAFYLCAFFKISGMFGCGC